MVVARIGTPFNQQGDHPGLIAQRFALKKDEMPDPRDNEPDSVKKEALDRAIKALANAKDVYKPAFELWEKSFDSTSDDLVRRYDAEFKDGRRVVVGLGADSVIETGVALSHTYGVPYLPGSSIKGMTSSYCHNCYGAKQAEFKEGGEVHRVIFGDQDESGVVVFHDAWIEPNSVPRSLKLDVMTPHHTEYNGGGSAPPSDFDSPNPILFLSVVGKFRVYLTIEERLELESAKVALDLAAQLVKEAFETQGIGGKKSSGYGLVDDPNLKTDAEKAEEARKELTKQLVAQTFGATATIPNKGETRTLRRIKSKGDPRFWDDVANKECIVAKNDQKRAKELYPLNTCGSFVFVQQNGDKLQYKLPE